MLIALFKNHLSHFRLLDFQIGLRFQDLAHLQAIGLFVALGSGGPHSRAAGGVKQAELDADRVGDFAHDATQGVYLPNQVPLGDAADGGIAGHLGDEIDIERVESGLQAHASRGHGGLASGVSGAHHDNVELFGKALHSPVSYSSNCWLECRAEAVAMDRNKQTTKADLFRAMHRGRRILLLPNAWDAVSARVFEEAGFGAIATTSAGIAFTLGYPDGQRISRQEMLGVVRRIAAAVKIPVTADVEAGYGNRPEDAAQTAREVAEAGGVGMNLEDATGDPRKPLLDLALQVERVKAVQEAAREVVVLNARTDVYLLQLETPKRVTTPRSGGWQLIGTRAQTACLCLACRMRKSSRGW